MKKCEICGEEFESNYHHKKYCSIKCSDEARRRRKRAKTKAARKARGKATCAECGKEYEKLSYSLYCSIECRNKATKRVKLERAAERAAAEANKGSKGLSAAAREAREHGMTYGKWMQGRR